KGGEFVFYLKNVKNQPQISNETPSIIIKKEKNTYNTIKEKSTKPEEITQPKLTTKSTSNILQSNDFQFIKPFQQGFSIFRKNELWGFVNHEDKVVLEPQFYQAYSFLNDKALVRTRSNAYQYFTLENQLINEKGVAVHEPTLVNVTVVKSDFKTIICTVSVGIVEPNQTLELFDKNNNRQIVTVAEVKYRGIAVDSAQPKQSIKIVTKERLANREAMILAEPNSMTLTKNFEGEAFLKSLVRHDDIPPFPSSFNNYLAIYNLQSFSININVQGEVKSWKKHQNFDIIATLRQAIPLRIGQLIQMKGSRGGECQVRKILK
ncbi:MAG: WG repeat-containing protein, partial [Saprospiraceae bacterium]